jgi:predicted phosphodiesterase
VRVAVVSDIHGNVRGLDACLTDLEAQGGADRIVGAGDLCAQGPWPREVLERLEDVGAECLLGNTDRYIVSDEADEGDAESLHWLRERLGAEWLAWLAALPFSVAVGDGPGGLLIVHASPRSDDEHLWPDAADALLERALAGVEQRTVAFGHLHLPYVRLWRDRMLVNVASAGLPKDGDPRASYAIFTQRQGGWEVKHRRVAFDVDEVASAMRSSGMPHAEAFVDVLLRHRYPQLGAVVP